MEIKILEETNNKIKLEIKGEDHSLCNALRNELWHHRNTELAGYSIEHPLVSDPIIVVEAEKPRKTLLKSTHSLAKKFKELQSLAKKLK